MMEIPGEGATNGTNFGISEGATHNRVEIPRGHTHSLGNSKGEDINQLEIPKGLPEKGSRNFRRRAFK